MTSETTHKCECCDKELQPIDLIYPPFNLCCSCAWKKQRLVSNAVKIK